MTATLLKFLHIAAISVWAAGLICFPFLNRQRNDAGTMTDLHRLHSMARFFYVVVLSPAAFVAIGSGIVLIFKQQTFTEWFSIKLLLVGLLAVIHLLTGRVLLRLFDKAATVTPWHYPAVTAATIAIVTAIVIVVLVKPHFEWRAADGLFKPGGLGEAYEHASFSIIDHQADAMVEDQLAAVPSRQASEDRRQYREGQAMRQHLLGGCQPQTPICTGDGEQHHRCDAVRPTAHPATDALHCQQLRSADQGGQYAQPEREPRAPDARTQEERVALKPIEHVDAQRGEH
nr:CopD family protein [Steroidobacter cummioxidans]